MAGIHRTAYLVQFSASNWRQLLDVRLLGGSPTVNAGARLPNDCPDLLRKADAGKPDIGALPLGAERFNVQNRRSRKGTYGDHLPHPFVRSACNLMAVCL